MAYSVKNTVIAVLASLMMASAGALGSSSLKGTEWDLDGPAGKEAKMKYEAAVKEADAAGLIKELKNLHVSSPAMKKFPLEKRIEIKQAHDAKCEKIAEKIFGKAKGSLDPTAHGIQRSNFMAKCTVLNYGSNN